MRGNDIVDVCYGHGRDPNEVSGPHLQASPDERSHHYFNPTRGPFEVRVPRSWLKKSSVVCVLGGCQSGIMIVGPQAPGP